MLSKKKTKPTKKAAALKLQQIWYDYLFLTEVLFPGYFLSLGFFPGFKEAMKGHGENINILFQLLKTVYTRQTQTDRRARDHTTGLSGHKWKTNKQQTQRSSRGSMVWQITRINLVSDFCLDPQLLDRQYTGETIASSHISKEAKTANWSKRALTDGRLTAGAPRPFPKKPGKQPSAPHGNAHWALPHAFSNPPTTLCQWV